MFKRLIPSFLRRKENTSKKEVDIEPKIVYTLRVEHVGTRVNSYYTSPNEHDLEPMYEWFLSEDTPNFEFQYKVGNDAYIKVFVRDDVRSMTLGRKRQ